MMKMLGCTVCIGGVFAYSLVRSRSSNTAAHPPLSPLALPNRAAAALLLMPARSSVRTGQVEMPRSGRAAPRWAEVRKTQVSSVDDACSRWNARR